MEKILIDEVKRRLAEYDLKIINENDYKSAKSKFPCLNRDGYIVMITLNKFKEHTPQIFEGSNPYTIHNLKIWLSKNYPNVEILHCNYKNSNSIIKCRCKIHNCTWDSKRKYLTQGRDCPECRKIMFEGLSEFRPFENGESFYDKRPDLLICFDKDGIEESKKYTQHSNHKINTVCHDCGANKVFALNALDKYGFNCPVCSTKTSYPNRFMFAVLSELGLKFNSEKIFDWSNKKRYDFYIEDLNLIIEMHGLQHYENKMGLFKKSLEQEKENDSFKFNMAKNNNIENYIIVDSRISDFDFIKNNMISELSNFLDFGNLNWENVRVKLLSNSYVDIWKAFDEGKTITELMETRKRCRQTIISYLKIGESIGKCNYISKKKNRRSEIDSRKQDS